jgi:hypothetical protein
MKNNKNTKMKSLLIGSIFTIGSVVSTGANAVKTEISETLAPKSVDYYYFSTTGRRFTVDIKARDWRKGLTGRGLNDSMIRIFEDDGSSIPLTGAFVIGNDDRAIQSPRKSDSLLTTMLEPGNYILAVGSYDLEEEEARTGEADSPTSRYAGDYLLTTSGDYTGDYEEEDPVESVFNQAFLEHTAVAGQYVTFGAGASVNGHISAVTYATVGAEASVSNLSANAVTVGAAGVAGEVYTSAYVGGVDSANTGLFEENSLVQDRLKEIDDAQESMFALQADFELLPTTSSVTFVPGVYSAPALTTSANSTITLDGEGAENPVWIFNLDTYLVTGAGTEIEIVNAGEGAVVIWNAGNYVSLGGQTSFIGAAFASHYISGGAEATLTCGNLFAKQYITGGAESVFKSESCPMSDTWAGSVNGLLACFSITDDGVISDIAPEGCSVDQGLTKKGN